MKKIMFNDKYSLTRAVLEGRKTMTRRLVHKKMLAGAYDYVQQVHGTGHDFLDYLLWHSSFKVGDLVAVAQKYKDIMPYLADSFRQPSPDYMMDKPGYNNKMFVRADLMPHRIRITKVRVVGLQDISDEDCLREGIYNWKDAPDCPPGHKDSKIECYGYDGSWDGHITPITAFAALIDKVSGKGTWQSNPWVFVYEFELYKEGKI